MDCSTAMPDSSPSLRSGSRMTSRAGPESIVRRLGHNLLYYTRRFHPCQPGIESLELGRKAGMVYPAEVEHGGVEIVYRDDIVHRFVSEFICRAVGCAAFDSCACQPGRERQDMMVAAVALCHWRSAELSTPDYERV